MFAQKELNVAKYYFDHEAYIAARNRIDTLLKSYPHAPQTKPALSLRNKINKKLTMV